MPSTEAEKRSRKRYKKRKYAERKAAGTCRRCGAETFGKALCPRHREKVLASARRRTLNRNGGVLKKRGRKPLPVEERKRRSNERLRKKSAERKQLGLCVRCAKPANGFTECERCRAVGSGKRLRVERKALGLCGDCGQPSTDGRKSCIPCRDGDKANRAKFVAERRGQGLCVCGEPLIPHGRLCEPCWFRHKAGKGRGGSRTNWKQMKELLESQNYRCAYSGELLVIGDPNASVDHKTPRSRGGTNDLENLQWVSKQINQMKTDFTHDEFLAMCETILQLWKNQNQLPIESPLRLIKNCAA